MEILQRTSNLTKYHTHPVSRTNIPEKIHVIFTRTYRMKYIGCGVLDRCFTQPMLSWIVSDIKRRGLKDAEHVVVEVSSSSLKAINVSSGHTIFEHKFENICKFSHLPQNKNCFTYLTRESLEAPFMCHVFHTMDEAMVLELFATMRDMTKGVTPLLTRMGTSFGADAFAPGSQHFEVLFVGKIKVTQKRAPLSFVDDALEKFRQAELERSSQAAARRRHGSGSSLSGIPAPGMSAPGSPAGTPDSTGSRTPIATTIQEKQMQDTELVQGLEALHSIPVGSRQGSTEALSPASPEGNLQSLVSHTQSMDTGAKESILNDLKHCVSLEEQQESEQQQQPQHQTINVLMPPAFVTHTQSLDASGKNSLLQDLLMGSDRQQRVRSCSGDVPRPAKQSSLPVYSRSRVGSAGPLEMKRPRKGNTEGQPGSGDQPHLNRAMLLLIGKLDLCLIGTDMKQIMLNKTFSDISHCCKGVQHPDNFGFICREVSLTQKDSYVGYIFRCQTKHVVDEIMQTLKQAFNTAHQAYQRQQSVRGQLHLCDTCPMHWFHRLCVDLEGLPPDKMHLIILRRMKSLTESEQEDVMLKYQGAQVSSTQEQNEIFMMLLRGLCEHKQVRHAHTPSDHKPEYAPNEKKPTTASKLDSLKQKARKSISNSFDSIMKRRSKEDLREKCLSDGDGLARRGSTDGESPDSSPAHSPGKREGSCEFPERRASSPPLSFPRPRSSTVGSAADVKKNKANGETKSPIMNIFMKVGSSTRGVEVSPTHKKETPNKKGPWRQAIFRRVQAPVQNALPPDLREGRQGLPSGGSTRNIPRSPSELRRLWKKAIMEQILLIRMDKENSKLQRNQDAASYKRMKLDYEEVTPCLKEDGRKWGSFLLSPSRPHMDCDVKELKEMVRAGVPRHERGEIWLLLSEQYCLHNSVTTSSPDGSDTPYGHLLKRLTPHQHAILIDLGRTFPSHPYFAQSLGPGQLSLFNLLKAYSLLDPEVGYCQGLSFVAGVLLLHMSEDNAFHLLKHIHFRLGFRKQYRPDMLALQVQMYQLSRLIHDLYPEIHSHFEQYEVAPTLYAAPWFLTLFASQFPLGFVSRLFDVLFLCGMEAVFKVALVLLGEHQESILDCPSFESVMEFLKTSLPAISIIQMERVFSQVFALEISTQLQAYEVEYNLLQEELQYAGSAGQGIPPPPTSPKIVDSEALVKLESANRNLKRQNMELNDQLQVAQTTVFNLETSLETYQSTVKHLESRVRSLEDERDGLLHSVNALRKRLERMERNSLSSEPGSNTLDLAPLTVTESQDSKQSLATLVRRLTEDETREDED